MRKLRQGPVENDIGGQNRKSIRVGGRPSGLSQEGGRVPSMASGF